MKPVRIPSTGVRLLLISCAMLAALAALPRAGSAAEAGARRSSPCLECHTGMDTTLARTPHQVSPAAPDARVACTDCHGTDPGHEEDAAGHPMTNPARVRADAEARLCARCHLTPHQQQQHERDAHLANDVGCSACHVVHRPAHDRLLKARERDLCAGCHPHTAGELARPSHHPVNEGVMRCSECHIATARTPRRLERGSDETCTRCHPQMQGPFPHEHPATLGFATDEGGCLACHEPHGAALPRLLRQSAEGAPAPLCAQCHVVPGHRNNVMHGTRWADVPCVECHSDLHGSYVSRLLLSESLRTRGCFNVGCHAF